MGADSFRGYAGQLVRIVAKRYLVVQILENALLEIFYQQITRIECEYVRCLILLKGQSQEIKFFLRASIKKDFFIYVPLMFFLQFFLVPFVAGI